MNKFICNKCKDGYFIFGPERPGSMRAVDRCNCSGASKYFFLEWLNENKKYIHTSIQNGDVTMDEVIKILNNE